MLRLASSYFNRLSLVLSVEKEQQFILLVFIIRSNEIRVGSGIHE